ncbi:MAG: EF-hand domain-containing protein [Sulfuricurvum sp.]|jgi:Ca2+-binding EF-hand superfamily protein|uniref:EF-hand domain-containing protein n=1 Tax=Sulfuricurvum sp. TaxID=2025608 RepID=UPI0025ED337C|nr:EF-hand domain-containing protein [Sulfuricurvum sp.]MCK9371821.1 EF-hand domain-containing protein [Sulfuricurvum sp.]
MTVSSNYSAYSSNSTSGVSSASQKGKPDFEKMAQELLNSLDTDKSGSIDKAEFSAAAQALASSSSSSTTDSSSANDIFSTLDTDSSGSMSTEEFVTALKNMKPPEHAQGEREGGMPPPPPGGMPPPPPPSESSSSESESATEIFSALDTNQDGTISSEEFMALFEEKSSESTTASTETTATASTETETDDAFKTMRNDMLQKILSYYGSNASSSNSTSLLSISA